jgi:hypothetical protein
MSRRATGGAAGERDQRNHPNCQADRDCVLDQRNWQILSSNCSREPGAKLVAAERPKHSPNDSRDQTTCKRFTRGADRSAA